MKSPLSGHLVACRASKPLNTWALASRCSNGSVRSRSTLDGASCMTSLTSTPGSMSIRVEGGP